MTSYEAVTFFRAPARSTINQKNTRKTELLATNYIQTERTNKDKATGDKEKSEKRTKNKKYRKIHTQYTRNIKDRTRRNHQFKHQIHAKKYLTSIIELAPRGTSTCKEKFNESKNKINNIILLTPAD